MTTEFCLGWNLCLAFSLTAIADPVEPVELSSSSSQLNIGNLWVQTDWTLLRHEFNSLRESNVSWCSFEACAKNKGDSHKRLAKRYPWCFKELRHRSFILKKKIAKLFKIIISNPFQSSPSSAILVPFCFRIAPLVLFTLLANHKF